MKLCHSILPVLGCVSGLFLSGCGEKTADACLLKAEKQASVGNWQGARKSAERAVRLEPNYNNALLLRAIACEKTGSMDLALDSARQAVTLYPDDFYAQYTLGRLYAQDPTRLSDAFKALYKAHKLKPENVDALILLTNLATALKSNLAWSYLLTLGKLPDFRPDSIYHNQLGIGYVEQGNFVAAKREFLTACADKNPLLILNTAVFLDRYTSSSGNARNFYQYFLKQIQGRPQYELSRQRVEARLRQLK